jgi:phage anti-repressor protein
MTNELIHIKYESEYPTVNGRELHAFLEVETPYHKWFQRMCEYGFVENRDFWTFLSESIGGRRATEHSISVSMAKELCMLQRSAKGKECREYFISCEEAWNSPEKIMERALQIAHKRAVEAERRIFGLLEKNETLEIALNESLKYYTVAKYNKAFGRSWNMSECQEIGKKLSGYCRGNAIEIRKCDTNDERFGSVNSYPLTAWNNFLENMEQ